MRAFRLLFVMTVCLCVNPIFAQQRTAKIIEDDLLKSFMKIKYWDEKNNGAYNEKTNIELFKANDVFGKKLSEYTRKYPSTISQSFLSLTKNYLNISTSEDGLFRIYAWDTETGGTHALFQEYFSI